jgi:hypothetical protein
MCNQPCVAVQTPHCQRAGKPEASYNIVSMSNIDPPFAHRPLERKANEKSRRGRTPFRYPTTSAYSSTSRDRNVCATPILSLDDALASNLRTGSARRGCGTAPECRRNCKAAAVRAGTLATAGPANQDLGRRTASADPPGRHAAHGQGPQPAEPGGGSVFRAELCFTIMNPSRSSVFKDRMNA